MGLMLLLLVSHESDATSTGESDASSTGESWVLCYLYGWVMSLMLPLLVSLMLPLLVSHGSYATSTGESWVWCYIYWWVWVWCYIYWWVMNLMVPLLVQGIESWVCFCLYWWVLSLILPLLVSHEFDGASTGETLHPEYTSACICEYWVLYCLYWWVMSLMVPLLVRHCVLSILLPVLVSHESYAASTDASDGASNFESWVRWCLYSIAYLVYFLLPLMSHLSYAASIDDSLSLVVPVLLSHKVSHNLYWSILSLCSLFVQSQVSRYLLWWVIRAASASTGESKWVFYLMLCPLWN